MRRIIALLIILSALLGGCNLPRAGTLAPPKLDPSISGSGSAFQGEESPSKTRTPIPTSTEAPPPTPTLSPAQIPDGPALQALESGEAVIITMINMLDEQSGWGIGHQTLRGSDHILFTEDGGQTWQDRSPPEPSPEDPGETKTAWAYFADERFAWVIYTPKGGPPPIGDQYVWNTHDGGKSWEPSTALPTLGLEAYFVPEGFAFISEEQGWLLVHIDAGMSHDYSYLFSTNDGGATWLRVSDPYGDGIQSLHNSGIVFLDADFGWVSKDNLGVMAGAFFEQTLDGGSTWEDVFLPAPPEHDWFTEFSRCNASSPLFTGEGAASLIVKCRLYGDDASTFDVWSFSYIYTTQDLGETWQHTLLSSPVESLLFLDEKEGWAFGREYYKTIDGGLTWAKVKTVNWDGQFSFVDPLNGWAVARNLEEIALVKTTNGGQTWQIVEPVAK
ncbi:MAG: hypothetical protein H8D34_03055 [Chloroflexi bacterium]|nr:hypothetical protein [Chloroflexota bacterium]